MDSEIHWLTYGVLKYPISSLVFFGLLGTVWGLQKSIYSLLPTMQGELDLQKLQVVMERTLTGMQTAFSTTLAGLIFSIILSFLSTLVLRSFVSNYLLKTKTFLIQHILPAYTLLGSEHLNSLNEKTKDLKETITDIVKQNDILFQPIVESANNFLQGMSQVSSAAQTFIEVSDNIKDMSKSFNSTINQFSEILSEVKIALDDSKNVQEDIEKTIKYMAALPGHFENLMKHLSQEFKEY